MKKNGGTDETHPVLKVPPLELLDSFGFVHTRLFKNREFLYQKYVSEGLSLAQISEQICSSKEAIRKRLEYFGISVREPHNPHGRPAQPRYGQRLQSGKSVVHQAEQRVIDAILELKVQGMGLRQIARTMTQLGISTKCRGKAWHPQMVSRILENIKHPTPK